MSSASGNGESFKTTRGVEEFRTQKYGYRAPSEYDLRPGGKHLGFATEEMKATGAGDVLVDGEVVEADPTAQARPDLAGALGPGARCRGVHPPDLGDPR
jgi:hypothetical protein